MNKKLFATIGMVACALLIVVGIVTLAGDNECSHAYSSSIYDSGFTTFGADFYTYSSNNTAEAASAARTTANNLYALYDLVANLFGWLFVFAGLMGLCHFGMQWADCPAAAPSPAPAAWEPIPTENAPEQPAADTEMPQEQPDHSAAEL